MPAGSGRNSQDLPDVMHYRLSRISDGRVVAEECFEGHLAVFAVLFQQVVLKNRVDVPLVNDFLSVLAIQIFHNFLDGFHEFVLHLKTPHLYLLGHLFSHFADRRPDLLDDSLRVDLSLLATTLAHVQVGFDN